MHIELAEPADLPSVMEIIARCTDDMQRRGIDQWDEFYPTRELVEADLQRGSLYVARILDECAAGAFTPEKFTARECVGAIALDDQQPDQYQPLLWRSTTGRALVIHRLCVHPTWQGQSIARTLMDFAERFAAEHSFTCIRLDAYPANPRAIAFYKSRGYELIGQVVFPRRQMPFECFEKLIGK